mgnify:CR=1 FL=1
MSNDFNATVQKGKHLWISWEIHRRSQSISSKLGIPLIEFSNPLPRWIRHPLFLLQTSWLLAKRRPSILFVQNPSVVLTMWAIIFRPLLKYKLIVDAHNAGIYPFEKEQEKYAAIFPFVHRKADLTIVTNKFLAEIVDKNGGNAVILPDPLPEFQISSTTVSNTESFVVTMICSFANDEPYLELFEAAALLPKSVRVLVTGNNSKLAQAERDLARQNNVHLTGFLSEEDYLNQLSNSDCIIVLTTFNDCMVCGAYEAVSLEIPLILSNSPVLKTWFGNAAIYTENKASMIAQAIIKCKEQCQSEYLYTQIRKQKVELNSRWDEMAKEVQNQLAL